MDHPEGRSARRVLGAQLLTALGLAVAAMPLGVPVARSVLLGSGICLAATAVFALVLFGPYRASRLGRLAGRCYVAEVAKLGVALGLFALVFAVLEGVNVPALLAAYLVVQILPTVFASP